MAGCRQVVKQTTNEQKITDNFNKRLPMHEQFIIILILKKTQNSLFLRRSSENCKENYQSVKVSTTS